MKDVQDRTGILLLTAEKLEGYKVVDYLGLVSGQSVMGANFMKDFFARLRDVAGGRVRGYERSLDDAIGAAVEEMALNAEKRGANAVIAIDMETGSMGTGMLLATCLGTAVRIEQIAEPSMQYANPRLG